MEWQKYGDVNARQHGAVWIAEDEDISNSFYVIRWTPFSKPKDVGIGYMDDLYVDLTDNWFDWNMVNSYNGANEDADNITKVLGLIGYYDYQNFGSREIILNNEDYNKMLIIAEIPVKDF